MNFQIGQKVVCVDNKTQYANFLSYTHLLEDRQIYSVTDIRYCSNCARQSICVGYNSNIDTYYACGKCKNMNSFHCSGKIFHYSSRFVPLEEYEASEKMVEELLQPIKEKA